MRELESGSGLVRVALRALLSMRKRPGTIAALPPAALALSERTVDLAHLSRYRSICGFDDTGPIPLTYPQVLAFPLLIEYLLSTDCPWPAIGLLHVANSIRQRRPLDANERFRVELRTGALASHPRGQAFSIELSVRVRDETIWEATQTLLRTGVQSPAGEALTIAGLDDGSGSPAWLRLGDWEAPADIGRRYAAVSGDFNPIHLSAFSARLSGLPTAIAHGLWTQASALALLERAASRTGTQALRSAASASGYSCINQIVTRFMAPVRLPAKLSLWSGSPEAPMVLEVRDGSGERVHLRSQIGYHTATCSAATPNWNS